uniref:1-acylglycerol-3-phosphate O-acyltransferase n=1 Tax=Wollemia nobilis TaxID=56998 RepID=A0A0C9RVC8_9CONI
MELPSALVVLPMGVLFLVSGLVVNCIQILCFIILWPFSKRLYRMANRVVAELLWIELVWLVDWWAGLKIRIYADPETLQFMGKEHALVISNHRSDVDWLVGWVLAQRSGCLGSALAVMKNSSKYLPVMGWSMWFSEYVFLERNWVKDEARIKLGLQRLRDFPKPFWLALFVEGTRFTKAKLVAAQEYAASTGLPVPRNVLIPRTKGFVSAVSNLREFVPAIYDVTVAVPKDNPSPTMLRLFKCQPSVLHVHIKRHPMTELPNMEDGVAQWLRDLFIEKDNLLDRHQSESTFGEHLCQPLHRPVKPLLVILGWFTLLSVPAYKLLRNLLSSRQGSIWLTVGIVLTTLLMHVFIRFSQSEHSTPAKVAPSRASNGRVAHNNKQA